MPVLEASAIDTLVSSMGTTFTSMTSDMMSGIGTILTAVLPIVGGVAVITLGIRLFKKLSKG